MISQHVFAAEADAKKASREDVDRALVTFAFVLEHVAEVPAETGIVRIGSNFVQQIEEFSFRGDLIDFVEAINDVLHGFLIQQCGSEFKDRSRRGDYFLRISGGCLTGL